MTFNIESDIPLPSRQYGSLVNYGDTFAAMNPGQSFFAPLKPASLSQYAREWVKETGSPFKFIARAEGTGARIWRKS